MSTLRCTIIYDTGKILVRSRRVEISTLSFATKYGLRAVGGRRADRITVSFRTGDRNSVSAWAPDWGLDVMSQVAGVIRGVLAKRQIRADISQQAFDVV